MAGNGKSRESGDLCRLQLLNYFPMHKVITVLCFLISLGCSGQDIPLLKGWVFKTGDGPGWASPNLPDSGWSPIEVNKAWELQGHENYDGFAWYRIHVQIPSSIRSTAFLKEKLRIDLGKIDDGDEVFLNGSLIGRNAGKGGDIKQGRYDIQRTYYLSLNDPRIQWDKDNLIAVRVWDGGGDGGLYEGTYGVSVAEITDYVVIETGNDPFQFGPGRRISKKIKLRSSSDKYDFTGKLRITIQDPIAGAQVFKQVIGADFSRDRPFEYTYHANLAESKSYQAVYEFEEGRTKKTLRAVEWIPYVLTPPSPARPRINGAQVFGIRPATPFLYKIAASGQRPLQYTVSGLPAGLVLDKQTGIISGALTNKGDFRVKLTVTNKLGTTARNLTIRCGELIGLTPAMGWNSWNCWGTSVNDQKVRASAEAMAGWLADHGWNYINIDDGWQAGRSPQGEILPNNKFPDMKGLCSFVHGLGLKIGIYSSPGPQTCGGFTGTYQHEVQDAKSYADWGIDYLKYDWCSYGRIAPATPSLEDYKKPYTVMRAALDRANRSILFSFCQYGMGDVWDWGASVGGNSWRTTGDITDSWSSMSGIGFEQGKPSPHAQPGHFNDPDMLVVGKVGWGPGLHDSRLSPDEQYTHISLWCLLSAPLLIGCDISQLDAFTLNLLNNDEVLALDQDPLGKEAVMQYKSGDLQVWVKELEDGSRAYGIFNLSDSVLKQDISLSNLRLPAGSRLRDLWRQKDLGEAAQSIKAQLPPHGVLLLKAKTPH
jgi:alpha-galactosidase